MKGGDRVRPLGFRETLAGKVVGVTKKELTWTFELRGKPRTLSLHYSVFSSHFRVFLDNKTLHEGSRSLFSQFRFETTAEGVHFRIHENLFTFEFYINGVLFQLNKLEESPVAPRQSMGGVRPAPGQTRLSFREIPAFFGNASQSLRDIGSTRQTHHEQNVDLSNLPIPQLMKRKTEPFVDWGRKDTLLPPPLPVNRALRFEDALEGRGLQLRRTQTEVGPFRSDRLTPSVRNAVARDKLQMPAIFTETALRKTFRVPRGPPLVFDVFDPYESGVEQFLETDFDRRTTSERRVLNSMF